MITKLNSGLVIEEEFMKFGLSFFNIVIEIKTSKLIGQNIKVGVVGNLLMDTDFDTWWNRNWVNLFGVTERNDIPKFETNPETKISDFNSLRLYLLIYEYGLKYPKLDSYEISQKIQKRETFKRYPVPSFTQGLGFDGGEIDKKTVLRRVSNYKKRGKEIMENVCKGVFP